MKKLLPVYPWPMHAKIAKEIEAIQNIQVIEAIPGGPGPVLCIRESPPWACDAIVVLEPQKLVQGIDLVVSNGLMLSTVRDWMGATLKGAPINETLVAVMPK